MHIRKILARNLIYLGVGGVIGIGALILNLRFSGGGFGSTLIVIVAVILWITGMFFGWGSYLLGEDRRALQRLVRGDQAKSGHLAAASGVITVQGDILHSPLAGTPCAAYEYTVHQRRRRSGRNSRLLCIAGNYLVPTFLDGSMGRVEIRSFPSLEEFVQSDTNMEHAKALGIRLSQRERDGFFSYLRDRLINNSTDYRELKKDWYLISPTSWNGVKLEERALPVGVEVCAIGVWDQIGPSLGSPYRGRFSRISIEPGTPQATIPRIGEQAYHLAKTSLWCLGIALGLFFLMPLLRIVGL